MFGIRKQILLPVLSVILIALFITLAFVFKAADDAFVEAGRKKLLNSAIHVGNSVLEKINRAKSDVIISSEIPAVQHLLDEKNAFIYKDRASYIEGENVLMQTLGAVGGYYETFYAVSDAGMTLSSSLVSSVNSLNISNRAWFHEAMRSKDVVVSDPFRSRLTGDLLVAVAKRTTFKGNVGAVVGSLQIQKITRRALEVENNDWLRTVIISKNGMTVAALTDAEVGVRSYASEEWFASVIKDKNGQIDLVKNGESRLLAFYNLPGTDFYSLAFADKNSFLEESNKVIRIGVVASLIAVLLLFGIIFFIVTQITNRIKNLVIYAEEVGEGNLNTKIAVPRSDELGMLARAVNKMVGNLQKLIVKSQAAAQAKSDFLSRMSHEIRTPINAIVGMSKIASDSADLAKIHECTRKIDSSSKLLLGLINSILDMSKLEANKMELFHEPFDFEKMLMDVSNIISIKAQENQQKLHIAIDVSMYRFFIGDEARIAQVITNLLSNAMKFTPEFGTIKVDVTEKLTQGGQSQIELAVSDSGIGISKENQRLLFSPFEQADGGVARKFGGIGLGLPISKSIVQMMGGDIWVDSEEGEGSTFFFTILLTRAPSDNTTTELFKSVDVSNMRVLLLDSEENTRNYFTKIMGSFNITCETVADVSECLDALAKTQKNEEKLTIVFIDWSIATENDLHKKIKREFGCYLVALMSTMHWEKMGAQGDSYFDKHLSKPLFPSNLLNVINELMGMPVNASEVRRRKYYRFSDFHILLAEDLEINREIVFHALAETKIKISSAVDGKQVVEMFEKDPLAYQLIIMDVNMPEMDGYEATRRIRALPDEWAKNIPILAMTANAFPEDVKKSLASGMNDHITKPLNLEKLLAKLHHYLDKKNARNESQHPLPFLSTETPADKNAVIEISVLEEASRDFTNIVPKTMLNLEEALENLGCDVDFYKTLLSFFVESSGFAELIKNWEQQDFTAAQKSAHSIKGASGNLYLHDIFSRTSVLEQALKKGDADEKLYQACLESFERTKQEINELINTT